MVLTSSELESVVVSQFPAGFVDATARALVKANRHAHRRLADLPPAEKHDLFGHAQRACFESLWRHMASDFEGVTGRVRRNKRKTSSFTEVRCGRLVLTSSAVESPGELPRRAEFRNRLSILNQRLLFETDVPMRSDELIYGIFTHCTNNKAEVYSAGLVFPNRSGTSPLLYISWLDELLAALDDESEAASEEKIGEPEPLGLQPAAKRSDVSG